MSNTFTEKLRSKYIEARASNCEQKDASVYHCATSDGITKRSLNLKSAYVFCVPIDDISENKPKKNVILEYMVQALLVKEALGNGELFLPIAGKKWRLLDAERNFAGDDLSAEGKGKRLDLLAYEAETETYIVLELKVTRALAKAKRELKRYTSTMTSNLEQANYCYAAKAKNVQGYIIWPANDNPRKLENPWGVIEYDKTFLDKDKIESIKFDIIKEPD